MEEKKVNGLEKMKNIEDDVENMDSIDGMLAPAEPMGALKAMGKVLISPTEVFRSLEVKSHIVLPIVFALFCSFLYLYFAMDILIEIGRAAAEQQMIAAGTPMTAEMMEQNANILRIVYWISGVLGVLLVLGAKSGAVFGLSRIFGGKATFPQTLSVIAISYVVVTLGNLIQLPVMVATKTMVTFSPAMLMSSGHASPQLFGLLSVFDIFILWYLGISAIGVKVINRISMGNAAACVVIPFLLAILPNIILTIIEIASK